MCCTLSSGQTTVTLSGDAESGAASLHTPLRSPYVRSGMPNGSEGSGRYHAMESVTWYLPTSLSCSEMPHACAEQR